jgi:prolyl-tRNA synthetase
VRPAHPEEIRELLGASAGSLGGVGAKKRDARKKQFDLRIVADLAALKGRRNMTTGANKDDHHFAASISSATFRSTVGRPAHGRIRRRLSALRNGTLEVFKGMEIGHIFKLGTKYSESMGATC